MLMNRVRTGATSGDDWRAFVRNLYVHFPFCRRKCSYCALHSRAGASDGLRRDYVSVLAAAVDRFREQSAGAAFDTVYFGGGSPALCDLRPLFDSLRPLLVSSVRPAPSTSRQAPSTEFTVELHPLDVNAELLKALQAGGVNRISLGVQSLDDAVLADMGRGYTFAEAERAFGIVREHFDNAGIDLIVGYPGEPTTLTPRHARLAKWGLRHCSVYSLILEEKSILGHRLLSTAVEGNRAMAVDGARELSSELPSDDATMNRLALVARLLGELGLERYEISNYAQPGYECRHNLAVWRGEDYFGLGEGAHGRVGLFRTRNCLDLTPVSRLTSSPASPVSRLPSSLAPVVETVSPESDAKERRLFRLRTREGLDTSGCPAWPPALEKFVAEGLLTKEGAVYRLTDRGTEVCDSILAEVV